LKVFFGTLVKSKPGTEMRATTSSSLNFFSLVISMYSLAARRLSALIQAIASSMAATTTA